MVVFSLLLTSVLFKRNSNTIFFQYPEQSLNNSFGVFVSYWTCQQCTNKCFKKNNKKRQTFNVKTTVVNSAEMAQWRRVLAV